MSSWIQVSALRTKKVERRGPGVTPTIFSEMTAARHALTVSLRENCPVNKNPQAKNRGALRLSIRSGPLEHNGKTWRVQFFALDYIYYVINDTKPHVIKPKDKKALAFSWAGGSATTSPLSFRAGGGAVGGLSSRFRLPAGEAALVGGRIVLRMVHHPGTKANNFVERAREEAASSFPARAMARIGDAMLSELIAVNS